MNPGKLFILVGGLLIIIGVIFLIVGKIPGIGKLPGDIFIQKGNFSFYFPITTSILISILISLILFLCSKK